MSADFFDTAAPNGNTGVSGYGDGGDGYDLGGGPAPDDSGGDGGGADPFGYTGGSLLTPWSGHFDGSKFGVGGAVAKYTPFQFGDFNYNFKGPDGFGEHYDDPGQFKYDDFHGPDEFKGITAEDMEADPGYQFRLKQGQKVLEASKAGKGLLRVGGTGKALAQYGQEFASNEFDKTYARKAGEHDRARGEAVQGYQINRGNAAENFDRNVTNARTAHQVRQGDWQANADTSLRSSQLGYDVATGSYDRNYSKARTQWQDNAAHQQALASASNSASSQAYNRALDEYQMGRDEFYTNQDRQWGRLRDISGIGQHAADEEGAYADNYGARTGDAIMGGANARAAGRVASGNAYAGAVSDIGQAVGDVGMYYGTGGSGLPRTGGRVPGASRQGDFSVPRYPHA